MATPKSVNRDMQVKVIQLCDAAAALIQMHICTKYDDCSSYSLWDTDLNIELKQLLTLVDLITDANKDANTDTNAHTNAYLDYDAVGIA